MKITIDPSVYAKIMFFVDESPIEISGMGRAVRIAPDHYFISSAYLLSQENTPASTDIDAEAISQCLFDTREDTGDLLFWWHSHVNMGAFWSGTDMQCFEDLGGNGMLIGTVFNKRREMKTAIYRAGDDFFPALFKDDIKTEIGTPITKEQAELWKKEMADKCRVPKARTMAQHIKAASQMDFGPTAGLCIPDRYNNGLFDKEEAFDLKQKLLSVIEKAQPYTQLDHNSRNVVMDIADSIGEKDYLRFYQEMSEPMMRSYHLMDIDSWIAQLPNPPALRVVPKVQNLRAKKANVQNYKAQEKRRNSIGVKP